MLLKCFLSSLLLFSPIGIDEVSDDLKMKEALEMARQMDVQEADAQKDMRREMRDRFLKTIGMIESSGGKNFSHPMIHSGMHKGQRAAGTYGLMPNTVNEILDRMRQEGALSPELQSLQELGPRRVKEEIERNPELEQQLADRLAQHVLDKQGEDEEKAAYSWFQGHNLSPEEIEKRKYQEHDYVKKYKKYRDE